MRDRLRERLRDGEVAYGLVVSWHDPDLVEAAGVYGFDFVFIDAEHGALDIRTCVELVRAATCGGVSSLIRVPYGEVKGTYRYLDGGAHGLIFPHVASEREVNDVLETCLFPPKGQRGAMSTSRAGRYGGAFSPAEFRENANEAVWIFPVVEDVAGFESIDEILSVQGLQGIFVGPGDLALSRLASTGPVPEVEEMVDYIISRALAHGKVVATVAATPEDAVRMVKKGARILVVGVTGLIKSACINYLQSVPRRPV